MRQSKIARSSSAVTTYAMIRMDIIWIILTSLIVASRGHVENEAIFRIETEEFDSAPLQDAILSALNESTIQLINSSLALHDDLGNVINVSLAESVGVLQNYINGTVKAGVEQLANAISDVRTELMEKLTQHDDMFSTFKAMLSTVSCIVSRKPVYYNDECIPCAMFEGSCYRMIYDNVTWDVARSTCKDLGGDLAVILSQAKLDFINEIDAEHMWIGLTDMAVQGQLQWVDGTVFDSAAFSSWWIIGEPSGSGRCVGLRYNLASGTFEMDHMKCTSSLHFLCEMKP